PDLARRQERRCLWLVARPHAGLRPRGCAGPERAPALDRVEPDRAARWLLRRHGDRALPCDAPGTSPARYLTHDHAAPFHQPALAGGARWLAPSRHAAELRPLRHARRSWDGRPVPALVYDQRADRVRDAGVPARHLAAWPE